MKTVGCTTLSEEPNTLPDNVGYIDFAGYYSDEDGFCEPNEHTQETARLYLKGLSLNHGKNNSNVYQGVVFYAGKPYAEWVVDQKIKKILLS